jgi:hypothetical protein
VGILAKNYNEKTFFLLIIILFLVGCSNIEFECEPYRTLQNYTIQEEKYQFTYNTEKNTFAVIDKKCSYIKNTISEFIFKSNFTEKYANTISHTPKIIYTIDDASDRVISIIEKPLEDIKNDNLDNTRREFRNFIKKIPYAKLTYNINTISKQFKVTHETSVNALYDESLTIEEIDEIQYETSKFIFVFLDETNQISAFTKEVVNTSYINIFFVADGFLKKHWNWYKEEREQKICKKIQKILFKKPINYFKLRNFTYK